MSSKRKYQESMNEEIVHPSRQSQVPGSKPTPSKKPRQTEAPVYRRQVHASSVNAIKKRIRDVTRRLERSDDIPANVRVDDERALTAYQQELAAADAEKSRQKMIKRYHMVRFFERQKATRHLKKLRKRLLETKSTEEVEELKSQMHIAEVDLNYTQYCPLSEVYVSLYPQKSAEQIAEGSKEEASRPKPPLWAEVEKAMEEGMLDQLRNRVSNVAVAPTTQLEIRPAKTKPPPAMVYTSGMNRRERRSQRGVDQPSRAKNKSIGFERNQAFGASEGAKNNDAQDVGDGEESDGGFFEE